MRPRWCGLCGARVSSSSRTLEDPIAYCQAHEDAARAGDELPPDPLEELPTMAAELREVTHTAEEHVKHTGPGVQGARPGAAGSSSSTSAVAAICGDCDGYGVRLGGDELGVRSRAI